MGTRFEVLKNFFQVQNLREAGNADLEINADARFFNLAENAVLRVGEAERFALWGGTPVGIAVVVVYLTD